MLLAFSNTAGLIDGHLHFRSPLILRVVSLGHMACNQVTFIGAASKQEDEQG